MIDGSCGRREKRPIPARGGSGKGRPDPAPGGRLSGAAARSRPGGEENLRGQAGPRMREPARAEAAESAGPPGPACHILLIQAPRAEEAGSGGRRQATDRKSRRQSVPEGGGVSSGRARLPPGEAERACGPRGAAARGERPDSAIGREAWRRGGRSRRGKDAAFAGAQRNVLNGACGRGRADSRRGAVRVAGRMRLLQADSASLLNWACGRGRAVARRGAGRDRPQRNA
jgi:hypothetical protein